MSSDSKKRLSVDFYMDEHAHKIAWDYMENNVKVKSKWIRNIIIEYILGSLQVPQETLQPQSAQVVDITNDDLDMDGMIGF